MSQQKLIQAAYKVIAEEGLPEPKYIRYRYPTKKSVRAVGNCHKYLMTNEYSITLPIIRRKTIKDVNGTYIDIRTKKKFRIDLVPFSMKELIDTMAHEIAHLKFWNHGPEHISYTNRIISKLNSHLNNDGG